MSSAILPTLGPLNSSHVSAKTEEVVRMPSPYIYVNAPLPSRYEPADVHGRLTLSSGKLANLAKINDVPIEARPNGSVEERILSIFEHPEVLFGDPGFIPAYRGDWLERIGHFTRAGQPIPFVSMAFPYKVPNPLKTERLAPDMGESLMLRRFAAVLEAIERVYAPGGVLTILEEGILGRCQGVPPQHVAAYRAGIGNAMTVAAVDPGRITFHSLDDMVSVIPNFEARWIHEQERLRELWQQGDPAVRDAYATTTAASRTSVPTMDYEPEVLAAAYDPDQTDSALRYPRDFIDKVSHRQFFAYRALLSLRDSTGYLHQLRPHALKLTVSPKPENLAVLPVNSWTKILPYHGVPVLLADGRWEIVYRGALGRVGPLESLSLEGDVDSAPFAYRVME